MTDDVANAAKSRSLDVANISSMDKSPYTLTLSNATMVRGVASLRDDLANSSSQRSNSNPYGRFSKIGYCWSHGYKVSKTHTSESCTKIKNGHKEKATRRNPMGVSDWNKGWVT